MTNYSLILKNGLSMFCSLLLTFTTMTAQEIKQTRPWKFGDQKAEASFGYQLHKGDTILDGTFQLQTADLLALQSGGDTYFSAQGHYQANQPDSSWRIELGAYTASGPPRLSDYLYQVHIDGTQRIASGILEQGQPQGPWILESQQIEHSQPTRTLFRSEQYFTDAKATKSLKIETPDASLIGRFKRDAMAHDTWILFDETEPTEYWQFQDGRLTQIIQHDPLRKDTIDIWTENSLDLASSNVMSNSILNTAYFEVLQLWLQINDKDDIIFKNSLMVELLEQQVAQFERFSEQCNELPGMRFRPTFGVSVPNYPYSNKEEKQLKKISSRLAEIDTLINTHLQNTSLMILENTDASVAQQMEQVRQLNRTTLPPVRQLVQSYQKKLLTHLPRKQYYDYLWSQDKKLQANKKDIDQEGLKAIVTITDQTLETMQGLENLFDEKLNTKQRQKVLSAMEEELLVEVARLDSLIDNQQRKLVKRSGLKYVKSAVDKAQQEYSIIESVNERQRAIPQLITCVKEMNALAITLTKMPERWESIKKLYTDQVWNNFTATVMDDEIKKRITEAYKEQLLPYYEIQLSEALNCKKATQINQQLNDLHERMLALRYEDTEDIEDQLKGLNDPVQILGLFNRSLQ